MVLVLHFDYDPFMIPHFISCFFLAIFTSNHPSQKKHLKQHITTISIMSDDNNLTAAQLIRNRIGSKSKSEEPEGDKKVDLDDEIKRLEAELAQGDESSSDSDDDSESENDESDVLSKSIDRKNTTRKKKISFGETSILNQEELKSLDEMVEASSSDNAVICVSECASDEIAPLPTSSLPKCKSKKLKIDLEDGNASKKGNENQPSKKSKKRKRSKTSDDNSNEVNDGLRQAVLEVLDGYKPRSSERIPFYCRVCSHTSSNEEEFKAHKRSDFHKAAVQIERKKTYCKLCRKQLTSIVQMQEHLKSKPHKEKLEFVRARQRGERIDNRGRGPRQNRSMQPGRGGRGGNYGGRCTFANDNRKRQWC